MGYLDMKLLKLIIVITMILIVNACGGGGGSTPPIDSNTIASTNTSGNTNTNTNTNNTNNPNTNTSVEANSLLRSFGVIQGKGSNFIPSLTLAMLDGNGGQYAVVSGWYDMGGDANKSDIPPVKIYFLPKTGDPEDVTVAILGAEFSISVNNTLIADFNGDGIDDIFFPGFTDIPPHSENPSVVFLSRPGLPHQKMSLDGLAWSHGSTVVDLNKDGWPDVVTTQGSMWINEKGKAFTYHEYVFKKTEIWDSMGICSGDIDGSGETQLVVTDVMNQPSGLPLNDTWITKLNNDLIPRRVATLPLPYFDRLSTTIERSHDVACRVVDLNNDGKQDIVLFSYLWDADITSKIGSQSYVQIYLNQGNYVFTETSLTGFDQGVLASYTPRIIDFNGDGQADIWLMNTAVTGPSANQIWMNNGSGTFTQSKSTEIEKLLLDYRSLVGGDIKRKGIMLPVKVDGKWNFIVTSTVVTDISNNSYSLKLGYARTQWSL